MAIALFNNETEKVYFYNLLAARKLKDQRKEREGYEKEIENALSLCGEILKEYGARCNFIAEIDKIESAMEPKGILPPSATREESDYAEQITALTTELTDLLKKIPRDVSEDLEFFSKQIIDRRNRREETLDKEKELIELYPDANKVDLNQIFETLKHIFDGISFYSGEQEEQEVVAEENLADVIDFTNQRQKVIGIKKAPRSLLEKVKLADATDYSEELAKPITKTNSGLFGIVDDVFSEVNSQPLASEPLPIIETVQAVKEPEAIADKEPLKEIIEKKEELPVIEPVSVISEEELNKPIDAPKESEPVSETIVAKAPVALAVEEETVSLESKAEEAQPVASEMSDDSITFEMPEEFTLADLAIALCEDENGWMDIYEANKNLFDKIINEKNNGNSDGIEHNKELFAGLTIKVPTVFNKGKESNKALSKAA